MAQKRAETVSGLIINKVVLLIVWFAQELTPIALLYSTILYH